MEAQLKQLQKAIKNGDISTLARLFSSNSNTMPLLNSKDSNGNTPLHFSASTGNENVVKLFIKLGAEVDKENEYGWTPLMLASYNGHLNVAQFLIGLKTVQINKANALGLNALKCAIYKGHTQIMNLLIDRGADVNQSLGHLTALMIACRMKNHEVNFTFIYFRY
jgi:serine/threonine-protein phosphatase 6 regulatory ankyrin repeat subunit B